jgi:hypothetical protein
VDIAVSSYDVVHSRASWLTDWSAVNDCLGDVPQFAVAVLGKRGEASKRVVGVAAEPRHQYAFRLLDDRSGLHRRPHLVG